MGVPARFRRALPQRQLHRRPARRARRGDRRAVARGRRGRHAAHGDGTGQGRRPCRVLHRADRPVPHAGPLRARGRRLARPLPCPRLRGRAGQRPRLRRSRQRRPGDHPGELGQRLVALIACRALVASGARRAGACARSALAATARCRHPVRRGERFRPRAGCRRGPPHLARICGEDTFIPLGPSWDHVLPNEGKIIERALDLCRGQGPDP